MKRILTVSILLVFILSITAVTAHDNTTQDSEILSDETPIKEDLNIEIDYPNEVVPKQYGSGPFLSFKNVPSNFDTNAKIYVDDNYRRDVAISDTTEFTVNQLSEGEHIITAQIPETLKYNSLNVTHKFKLTYSKISIPQEIYSGQYGSAFVSIPYDADGYVKVKVDGKDFKSVKVEETDSVSVPLTELSLGKHVVEVTYTGGKYPKNYKKATVDCTFLISGISPEIIYGEQIHFFAPEDLTSKFKVIIDNKTYSTYHNGDYYTVNLTYLNPGTHSVKLIYPGDKKYPSKTITTNVTSKGEITYKLGTKKTNPEVYLKLPNDAKGKLNIFINGELFKSIPISNNIAYCNFTELRMGEYDLHATYTDDDYNIGNYTTPKTIPMEIKPIVIYPDSITYKQNAYLTFKVEKDINGSFLFGDEVVPIINGEGKFSLANMEIRQWNGFTITYENDTYRFRDDYSITVNPIPAKITGMKDTTLYYGESKTLTVKVLGDYGTPVEREHVNFYIGSTLYQIETNMKGVVNFKIPNTLAPGTYKLKALYHGHGVTKKLTVKQVLTLKAATVKKSAKSLTLTATLKNTKPMAGKQITFKFNGKTIGKTKTNSKGIAKITVKKSVLSKLKVGKKITYEATYVKNTVKKTATVKK